MRKFKSWLINQFLPAWAKETIYRENESLKAENSRLRANIDRLNAYIGGLENGMRVQRRISIRNEVKK